MFQGLNNAFSSVQNDRRTSWPNTIDFFLLRLLEDILEIPAPHMRAALTPRERIATAVFKQYSSPANYKRTRDFTNNLAKTLFNTWGMIKFGVDPRNATLVAEKLFV